MYPLTSRSSSGILIILLVFSEIQSFITGNDTSNQFCSEVDNESTKDWLKSEKNQDCHDDKSGSFGGLPNRLQKLPDLAQETPKLQEELNRFGEIRNKGETKSNQDRSYTKNIMTRTRSESRGNSDSVREAENRLRTSRSTPTEHIPQKRRNERRRFSEDNFRSVNRETRYRSEPLRESRSIPRAEHRLRSSRNIKRNPRSSDDISGDRRDERMNVRGSENDRETRYRSEPQIESRSIPRAEHRLRSSRNIERNSRSSNNISENRRDESGSSENDFRSANRETRYRSEPQRESGSIPRAEHRLRKFRNTQRNSRSSDNISGDRREERMVRGSENDFRSVNRETRYRSGPQRESRSSLRVEHRLGSSRNTENSRSSDNSAENLRVDRPNVRNSENDYRSANREARYRSEPRSLSRIRESPETRRNLREDVRVEAKMRRSLDRQFRSRGTERSTRSSNNISEHRGEERMNSKATEGDFRSVNRVRETRYRSEPRNVRMDARVDTTRESRGDSSNSRRYLNLQQFSSNANNRATSSRRTGKSLRSSSDISENRREARMNVRASEEDSRSVNRIREIRYHSESRTTPRIRETERSVRDNTRVDSIRSSLEDSSNLRLQLPSRSYSRTENRISFRTSTVRSEKREQQRMRSSDGSRLVNRTRRDRSESRSLSRNREFPEIRQDNRRDPLILRRSFQSLVNSENFARNENRLRSIRSTDKNSKSREVIENRREQRIRKEARASPDIQKHESSNRFLSFRNERNSNNSKDRMVMYREVSRVLDSGRNRENVAEIKLIGPILGKYSRTGETLESVLPKEDSTWIETAQISLVVVLLAQLFWFKAANEKNRFAAMNIMRTLKGYRA